MAKKVKLTKGKQTQEFNASDVDFMKTQGWKEAKAETPSTEKKGK